MLVLFVCVANVARSQMAEAFFNRLSSQHSAQSAETRVGEYEGRTVLAWANHPHASSSPTHMLEIMNVEEGRFVVSLGPFHRFLLLVIAAKSLCPYSIIGTDPKTPGRNHAN